MKSVYIAGVIVLLLTLLLCGLQIGTARSVQMIAGNESDALDPHISDSMRRMVTLVPGEEEKTFLGDQWMIRSALYLGAYEVRMDGVVLDRWDVYLVLATYTIGDQTLVETGLLRGKLEDGQPTTSTAYRSRMSSRVSPGEPVTVFAFTGPLGTQYWGTFLAGYVNDDTVKEFTLELQDGRDISLNAHEHRFFTIMLDRYPIRRGFPRPDPVKVERVVVIQ